MSVAENWPSRVAVAYPVAVLAAMYACWGAGRVALGYWPGPADDPKTISIIVSVLHIVAELLLISSPIAMFASFGGLLIGSVGWLLSASWRWRPATLGLLGTAAVLWLGFVVLVKWDPQGVVLWLGD